MLARENVSGSAHVGGELVDFVDAVDHGLCKVLLAEIADYEFVGGRFGMLVAFDVHGANPITFAFQPFHKMAADETAGAVYEYAFH